MICTTKDDFLQDKTIWEVTLSNGTIVYQDDNRNNLGSAWKRLKQYLVDNPELNIVDMHLSFRDHYEHIPNKPRNVDGYYCSKTILGGFLCSQERLGVLATPTTCIDGIKCGYLYKDKWILFTFRAPELIIDEKEIIDKEKASEDFVIWQNNQIKTNTFHLTEQNG